MGTVYSIHLLLQFIEWAHKCWLVILIITHIDHTFLHAKAWRVCLNQSFKNVQCQDHGHGQETTAKKIVRRRTQVFSFITQCWFHHTRLPFLSVMVGNSTGRRGWLKLFKNWKLIYRLQGIEEELVSWRSSESSHCFAALIVRNSLCLCLDL